MGWIFTAIIWALMFVVLSVKDTEIKAMLAITQVIVLVIQIIYTIFKS